MNSLLSTIVFGCNESNLPDDHRFTSEHFVYHLREDDDSVCRDVVDTMEKHFDLMQSYFGFTWPTGHMVHYYKYRDMSDFKESKPCPSDAYDGCQESGRIFTSEPLEVHELIHAYLDPIGLPPPIFLEGVAEAMSCYGYASLSGEDPPATWQISSHQDAYRTGQWLVAYLLRTYGPQSFLNLFSGRWYDADSDQIAARFAEVYGVSIDEVWAAATAERDPEVGCIFSWECDGEPVTSTTPISLLTRCDQADQYRTLTMTDTGFIDIFPESGWAYVRACPGAPEAPYGEFPEGIVIIGRTLFEVDAGTYFFQSDIATTLRVDTPAAAIGSDCPDVEVLPLTELPVAPRLVIRRQAFSRYMRFTLPTPAQIWLDFPAKMPSDSLEICGSCDLADCISTDTEAYIAADSFILYVPGTDDPSGWVDMTLGVYEIK